jgi:hypothetical protein
MGVYPAHGGLVSQAIQALLGRTGVSDVKIVNSIHDSSPH